METVGVVVTVGATVSAKAGMAEIDGYGEMRDIPVDDCEGEMKGGFY